MTPNDIILQALKASGVIGVGQQASAEDVNDALFQLNMMLAQWSRKRWLVYNLVEASFIATGAQSFTVGAGGDFNIPRPDKLSFAYFRQVNQQIPVDYPLTILTAREDYDRIALKSLNSWPQYAYYESSYPTGHLYVWPIPSSTFRIFITVKETLTSVTLAQTINLPPEYQAAIFYNLAVRLRPNYQLPPDPSLVALAKDSLNVLRMANTQLPVAMMPSNLIRGGATNYNFLSDEGG